MSARDNSAPRMGMVSFAAFLSPRSHTLSVERDPLVHISCSSLQNCLPRMAPVPPLRNAGQVTSHWVRQDRLGCAAVTKEPTLSRLRPPELPCPSFRMSSKPSRHLCSGRSPGARLRELRPNTNLRGPASGGVGAGPVVLRS